MLFAHRLRPSALALGAVTLLAATLTALGAVAQQTGAASDFSVQRFEPALGPKNFLSVAGSRTDGELAWSTGLWFDYALDPFVVRSCTSQGECADPSANVDDVHVVEHLLTWNAMATLTPIPRLQLGLRVPLAYAAGDGVAVQSGQPLADGLSAFAVGDPQLEGKVRIFGEADDPLVLGASASVKAPLGSLTSENSYLGDAPPLTLQGRAILDGQIGIALLAANLGGAYRPEGSLGGTAVGSELRYGAAVGAQALESLAVFVETFGATRFSGKAGTNALEILAGSRFAPTGVGVELMGGVGTGLVPGVGVPVVRGIVGIAYVSGTGDEDGDGIRGDADRCPEAAEDFDGVDDLDGCPEDDADGDGVADGVDRCPKEAETRNGHADDDGCPDSVADGDQDGVPDDADRCPREAGELQTAQWRGCPDSDGDGVADPIDKCPDEQEDTDAFEDTDGCLDPDNDGDGVPDTSDECGDEPEVPNGVLDTDGCPDETPDADGDGIADDRDLCPTQAETLNGDKDDDGCPEIGPKLAEVSATAVAATRAIAFDGVDVRDAGSRKVLDAIAQGLVNHPEVFLVAVVATTTAADAQLGPRRAQSVVARLRDKGVAAKRLIAKSEVGETPGSGFEVLWSTKRPRGRQ